MQLDVYTCSTLDIKNVFDALEEFGPTEIEYKYIDREHNLTVLDHGKK